MTTSIHESVGAYALGLLTPTECDQFEAHLVECDRCAVELEQFMGLAEVFPDVAEPSLVPASSPVASRTATVPAPPRVVEAKPKPRRRWVYALAACLVLIAVGVVGGIIGRQLAPDSQQPERAVPTTSVPTDPLTVGEQLSAVDPNTGTRARTALTTKGWGTNIALELSGVRGPLTCALVAVGTDGSTETAMTWAVPVKGYGTPENPAPLVLSGGTSLDRADLDRFEVRTTDGQVLVTIRA